MRFSLGLLLAAALAGLQFIAVLMVVFSSYITSEQALLRHARDLLRDVGNNTIEHARGFLNPAQGAAELAARLAENRVVSSDDQAVLEQLLFQQLQLTPQFSGLYYGGADGSFVMVMRDPQGPAEFRSKIVSVASGARAVDLIWRDDDFTEIAREQDPLDEFDPRARPWYQRAAQDLTTIWTAPYIFFSSRQPGISLAAPVLGEGQAVQGVVGVDIEISQISIFLSRLKIGSHGKAMILNKNGDVIAHPEMQLLTRTDDDGLLRFAEIREFGDPIARTAFAPYIDDDGILETAERLTEFHHDGARYVATVMAMHNEELPWTIAVYAPEDDFIGVIKRNREANIWIAALVAVTTGVIGIALAEFIHRPVRAFAVRNALIAQGEVDPETPMPKTYKELERANRILVEEINARRATENEYGQTFQMSSRAMAQLDPTDGKILRVNDKYCQILGQKAPAVIGQTLEDVIYPPDLMKYKRSGARGEGQGAEANVEMRWLRDDGKMIWVRLNAITIRDQKGASLHTVITVDDITQEKAQDGQIAQLNRDISHLARGNTMGQMAAGLAHELNQPLTAIAQNADSALLTLGDKAEDIPALRDILLEIERQSLRAGDIIRALRSFIRKDEGLPHVFDFSELLRQTLSLVHAEVHDSGITLRTDLEPLPMIEANRVQVAQVLVNLLRNAIEALATHHTEKREICVSAELDKAPSFDEPGWINVIVSDTGPGVAPGITLFTQFETSKADGMGLGLSICRSIIEANGGQLWHEPNQLGGAQFHFTLKAARLPHRSS